MWIRGSLYLLLLLLLIVLLLLLLYYAPFCYLNFCLFVFLDSLPLLHACKSARHSALHVDWVDHCGFEV